MTTVARQELERRREIGAVAKVYQDAVARGASPIKEVMERVGLSRATAIRRIKAARESGLLPADSRPIYSSKLVAVAQALSVDPGRLRDAVLEHAGGDLRVQPRESVDE